MLYSIGTSNRSLAEFQAELSRRGITKMIDVRSRPYSRLAWFNAPQIARWSERAGILYIEEGEILGGMSNTPRDDPAYDDALGRLIQSAQRRSTAIFCAEGDPKDCHRGRDIARLLLERCGLSVRHILRDGSTESTERTLERVRWNAEKAPDPRSPQLPF